MKLKAIGTASTGYSWCMHLGSQGELGEMFAVSLPDAVGCGFRAFLNLPAYYPADVARCFGPFVDLLLTRVVERKKPPMRVAANVLILFIKTGCGGLQPSQLARSHCRINAVSTHRDAAAEQTNGVRCAPGSLRAEAIPSMHA